MVKARRKGACTYTLRLGIPQQSGAGQCIGHAVLELLHVRSVQSNVLLCLRSDNAMRGSEGGREGRALSEAGRRWLTPGLTNSSKMALALACDGLERYSRTRTQNYTHKTRHRHTQHIPTQHTSQHRADREQSRRGRGGALTRMCSTPLSFPRKRMNDSSPIGCISTSNISLSSSAHQTTPQHPQHRAHSAR